MFVFCKIPQVESITKMWEFECFPLSGIFFFMYYYRCDQFSGIEMGILNEVLITQICFSLCVFLGEGDKVKCFHCGGGLTDWKPNEDPWEQHAKWYPG